MPIILVHSNVETTPHVNIVAALFLAGGAYRRVHGAESRVSAERSKERDGSLEPTSLPGRVLNRRKQFLGGVADFVVLVGELGDGTVGCEWVPTTRGRHVITVTLGGIPIEGSDFICNVAG